MVVSENPVPLADDSPGCVLGDTPRSIQDATVHYVTLESGWLSQLGIAQQGSQTLHSVALRPVVVKNPCYIIQPAEVVEF